LIEPTTVRLGATFRLYDLLGYGWCVDRVALEAWIEHYERAWRSPGTTLLAELFAPEATYSMAPFEEPHRGLAAIERLWEAERDGPDEEFTLETEIVAVEGDTGVVRAEAVYAAPPRHYRDLWIMRFDEHGRCLAFEEWPFWPAEPPK
jgi:ketosteroid isomerase-like protein